MNLPALFAHAEASGVCGVKLSDPRGIVVIVACCPTVKQNYDLAAFTLAWLQEMVAFALNPATLDAEGGAKAGGEVIEPSVQLVRQGGG